MFFILLAAIILLVGVDQALKYFVFFNYQEHQTKQIIDGLLDFTFVTNTGAAFSIFKGIKIILIGAPIIIVCAVLYLIAAKKIHHFTGNIAAVLIAAGGLGNLIDRVAIGYVIDYIDVNPLLEHFGLSFTIFNFADCCICVGAAIAFIYIIFFHDKYAPENERFWTSEKKAK